MAPPPLSIIVPSHNSWFLTTCCLESIFAAPLDPPPRVWVADDASDDETVARIRQRFPQVEVLTAQRQRGFTINANRGLEAADGDLLLLLNSDTEVEPGALAALVAAFERDSRLGVAGGQLHYPDGSPQWCAGREPSLLWLFALASGLPRLLARLPGYRRLRPLARRRQTAVDWVSGAALAIRRETWEEIGPMDESFVFYCQDLDLCGRARQAGWRVAVVAEARILHHHGATIGRRAGAFQGRQKSDLLWLDLLRWAHKHRPPSWAVAARGLLAVGARCRLLGRKIAGPFVGRRDSEAWARDGQALRQALHALRGSTVDGLS